MMNSIGIKAVKFANNKLYDTEQEWLEAFAKKYYELATETFIELAKQELSQETVEKIKNFK